MAKAWHIVNWEKHYEVNANTRSWQDGQEMRKGPLGFVRLPAHGCQITPQYDDLCLAAEQLPGGVMVCLGLWCKLLEVAAKRSGGERGWQLDRRNVPMTPIVMARRFRMDGELVGRALLALEEAGWIEVIDCAFAGQLPENMTVRPQTAGPQQETAAAIPIYSKDTHGKMGKDGAENVPVADFAEKGRLSASLLERNRTEGEYKRKTTETRVPACAAEQPEPEPEPESESESESEPAACGSAEHEDFGGVPVGASDSGFEVTGFGFRASGGSGSRVSGSGDLGFGGGTDRDRGFAPAPGADAEDELPHLGGEQVAVMRAIDEMQRIFPGMAKQTSQGRSDYTTIERIVRQAHRAGGTKRIECVVVLAQEKSRSRILNNPVAAWVADCRKRGLIEPATARPP